MKAAAIGGLVVVCATASIAAQQPRTGTRAVASVKQLHDILITPASDAVFRASGETPATDRDWVAARDQAVILAEAANLLMVGGRARDAAGWTRVSRALVDAAALAAAAADRKDANALEAATDSITVSCEACHRPYRDRGRQMGNQR